MKSRVFLIFFRFRRGALFFPAFLGWIFFSCGMDTDKSLSLHFPPIPAAKVFGEPHWRLEWYDPGGRLRQEEISGPDPGEIRVLYQWPSPLTAWPHWPERGIPPGLYCPAGALYPFDVSEGGIYLSWQAGVEANFYRELALARSLPGADSRRRPQYFDWPRFRSLLREEVEELREDPWLADWKDIAEKTALSGFRKSLVKAAPRTPVEIRIPSGGPWFSASPFREQESWEEGQMAVLNLSSWPEIYLCSQGILHLSPEIQLWEPF
ncbi:MAG: hypothetical protein LBE02_08495 [Spirochaetaceae bacterium]|jgi:hypothetical protein|nr:hypothetical protein [Spirochaetaceae bacterium]